MESHFDIFTSYLPHHGVTADMTQKIVAEAKRNQSPASTYLTWFDHKWNNERWSMEYHALDLAEEMRKAGFTVDDKSVPGDVFGKVVGTKTA